MVCIANLLKRQSWSVLGVIGLLSCLPAFDGCGRSQNPPVAAVLTADNVMQRMTDTYRHANSYRDRAVVQLRYHRDGRDYQDEAPVSVCWQAPNRIAVQAYQAQTVCDGQQIFARIEDESTRNFDGQIVVRDAPSRLTLPDLWEKDQILSLAFRQGLAGYPLQLDLLLDETPLAALRDEGVKRTLLEPAEAEGASCYRLQVKTTDGTFVLWVDRESFLLRRIEYPAATFAPEIAEDAAVTDLQLGVEFRDAQLDQPCPQDAFAFQMPADAKRVKCFIPPPRELPSDLFGQTTTPYRFTDLSGKAVSNDSLGDRIKVLVWFNNHPACQSTIQQVNRVYQQFQSQQRIAVYGVCAEPSSFTNEQLQTLCDKWQVELPVVRDLEALGRDLFQVPWAPTVVVLDGDNVVQIYEVGANPNLVAELPQVLEQLLAGDDVAGAILEQFRQEQTAYEKALARGEPEPDSAVTPATRVSASSRPQLLQLRPLWDNQELKATGNILAIHDPSGTTRFLIQEGWRTFTEIGGQGNLIARHALDLPPQAAVSQLRSARDGAGRRYYVGWSLRSAQVYVFDEQWKRVLSYPPESVQHDGVQDALLADLDGDGQLELHVGFWGNEGVRCTTLVGRTLWHNAAQTHVLSLMYTTDSDGSAQLWASSASGAIVSFDPYGRSQPLGDNSGQLIHHLFCGNPDSDAAIPFCGIAYGPEGRRLAIGLNRDAQAQWRYNLPAGSFPTQIRFVTAAPLLDAHQQHWLIAGTDGSVHIISQDGRFTDFFQTGKLLTGLAGGRYADAGILLISTEDGVSAFQVSPPATAKK